MKRGPCASVFLCEISFVFRLLCFSLAVYFPYRTRVYLQLEKVASYLIKLILVICISLHLGMLTARADMRPVIVTTKDTKYSASFVETRFSFLEKVQQHWSLCVILPNTQDQYWLSVKEGLTSRAVELHMNVQIYSASGYGEGGAEQQRDIFEHRCIQENIDLILIAAIDETKLYDLIDKAKQQKIIVVDFLNGFNAEPIDAKISLDFSIMGRVAATFLKQELEKAPEDEVCLYWFPGPKTPEWSVQGNLGFQEVLRDYPLKTFKTLFGLPFIRGQSRLILDHVETGNCTPYIAGTAPTALAALQLKKQGFLPEKTQILAYYFDPRLLRSLKKGDLLAIVSDFPYEQARLSIDYSALLLQREAPFFQIAIKPKILTNMNLN
ncbi:MAG: substrate-binding domain-containing protein [Sneathiella sp.]|nr:substrate-binding domain-containing protein [Sneathiella sp.]